MALKIVVVAARFNEIITGPLVQGAHRVLGQRADVSSTVLWVPGSFELPLAVTQAFEAGAHGVVALGAVIKGGTDHYHFVCQAATQGLAAAQREFRKPVGFGLLTCDTLEQALDRAGGKHGNKGADAAQAVLDMLDLRVKI